MCEYTSLIACFLFVALWSDVYLEQSLQFQESDYPCVLFCEELMQSAAGQKAVKRSEGGVRVFSHAWFACDVRIPSSGRVPVFLVARGVPVHGIYPCLNLNLDRKCSQAFFCTSEEWGLYRLFLDVSPGPHRIQLQYVNDECYYPMDRDIELKIWTIGMPPGDARQYYRWKAPVEISPARMCFQVYAECAQHSCRLWNHGMLADDIYFNRGGTYPRNQERRKMRHLQINPTPNLRKNQA